MPAWPVDVPSCPERGVVETPEQAVARFQPEVGPPKLRRRSSVSTSRVSMNLIMNNTERAAFIDFFEDDLESGALSFTMAHPVTQASHSWVFESQPQINQLGGNVHRVSVSLIRLP